MDADFVLGILGKSISPTALTSFIIIWYFVKKQVKEEFKDVKDHFLKMQNSVDKVSENVAKLQAVVERVEQTHTTQISMVDERVTRLANRLSELEKK